MDGLVTWRSLSDPWYIVSILLGVPRGESKKCALSNRPRLDVRRVGPNESSSMDAVLRRLQKEFTESEVAEAGAPSIVATATKPEFPVLKPEYRKN